MEVESAIIRTNSGVNIPKDWRLYTVAELISDGIIEKPLDGNHGNIHPKKSDFVSYGIPFIMANNVKDGILDLENCSFITEKQANTLQKGFSKNGDILLTHKGTIGNVAYVEDISTDFIMLTPQVTYYRVKDNNRIYNKYIQYFFQCNFFQSVFHQYSGGGTRSYIGISKQRELPFILPPLPEQKAIAEVLSGTDNLIQSLEKQIAKKRLIKQGAMQNLLSPKEGWEEKKLGELASFYKGKGLSKSDLANDGKSKCIHYGELFTYYDESIDFVKSRTNLNSNCFLSKKNDVLMPTSDVTPNGLATSSCINEGGVVLGGDVLVIRCIDEIIHGDFLSYSITNSKEQVMQLVSGTTVYHLYGSDMARFELNYPKKDEQIQIALILNDMKKEIKDLEIQLSKYKLLKKGLMQNLLTGRIRLK